MNSTKYCSLAGNYFTGPITNGTASKNSKINQKGNTVRATHVNTARPKAVLNAVQGNLVNAVKASTCWGNPQQDLKDKGVIDNGYSRHMIGNKSYLTDYKEIDGGFVAFEATKDETSEILKTFITSIENLIDLKVKVIRCNKVTEFKNRVMNKFCEIKGIKKEFNVVRTPQQNRVAKKKNRTLIEAARTMLADSKLPTTFWAEVLGRKPALSFMRPFGCHVTILNTIDHLGALTKSISYKPVVVGNQSNGSTGTKECDNIGKTRVETVPDKDYILLPLWTQEPLFSSSLKDSPGAGYKPSEDEEKKDAEDLGNKDSEILSTKEPRVDQEEKDNVNSTNKVNVVSSTINTANNEVNVVGRK
nr:hypothetical protein [Tanacetum cinerariifolium]